MLHLGSKLMGQGFILFLPQHQANASSAAALQFSDKKISQRVFRNTTLLSSFELNQSLLEMENY